MTIKYIHVNNRPFKRPFFFSTKPKINPITKNRTNDKANKRLSLTVIDITCSELKSEIVKERITPRIITEIKDKLMLANLRFIMHLIIIYVSSFVFRREKYESRRNFSFEL